MSEKNYGTVLFDLDGTITDSGEGVTNSIIYSLAKFGIEVEDRAELYKFIGPPLIDSFMNFYNFCISHISSILLNQLQRCSFHHSRFLLEMMKLRLLIQLCC